VYTREANGKEIELRVSGKLYQDALVMFDRETGTLWTQVDGSALRGPLAGHRLVEVPAMQTTWKVWKKLHPNTLVLQKPKAVRGSPYADYSKDSSRRGLFGTRGDPHLPGKTLILGIHSGKEAVAVPIGTLEKQQLLEIVLGSDRLVAFYSREKRTAAVFRAAVDGHPLSFRLRGRGKQTLVEDAETHSLWSPLEGRALAGALQGKSLEPVAHVVSYWYAWSAYRPHTRIVSGS
jgi:hypothetical protein